MPVCLMNAIAVLNKPKGPTSFDIVRGLRKTIHEKRIGHAGTLDPMASGVLVLCVGEATKLVPYFMDQEKEYEATICLGVTTDTDDAAEESKILSSVTLGQVLQLKISTIEDALQSFVGSQIQIPPRFSALKSGGQRLYEMARQVQTSEEKTLLEQTLVDKQREVFIHQITIIGIQLPYVRVKIICGKGTYIRSIARDLGEKLGVGAHLSELKRTRIGFFSIDQATPCLLDGEGLLFESPPTWISLSQAAMNFPTVLLSGSEAKQIRMGQLSALSSLVLQYVEQFDEARKNGQPLALIDEKNDLVAILVYEYNKWKIGRGFYSDT